MHCQINETLSNDRSSKNRKYLIETCDQRFCLFEQKVKDLLESNKNFCRNSQEVRQNLRSDIFKFLCFHLNAIQLNIFVSIMVVKFRTYTNVSRYRLNFFVNIDVVLNKRNITGNKVIKFELF